MLDAMDAMAQGAKNSIDIPKFQLSTTNMPLQIALKYNQLADKLANGKITQKQFDKALKKLFP